LVNLKEMMSPLSIGIAGDQTNPMPQMVKNRAKLPSKRALLMGKIVPLAEVARRVEISGGIGGAARAAGGRS
jgi:hypothetical protein